LLGVGAYAEQVRYVIDGDTFIMADESRVRLSGIDAPELTQPFGQESRVYLDKLVAGRDVVLQCNGEMSYNRRVCDAFVAGLDIQRELVGRGLAFDYSQYSHGKYRSAEDFAYRMKRGVWSGGMRPWDYRRQQRLKSMETTR
jgi:endonuclease YncB( thermonuclease family)